MATIWNDHFDADLGSLLAVMILHLLLRLVAGPAASLQIQRTAKPQVKALADQILSVFEEEQSWA